MSNPEIQKAENTDKFSVFSLFQAGDERIEGKVFILSFLKISSNYQRFSNTMPNLQVMTF